MSGEDSLRFVVIGVAASIFKAVHRRAIDAEKINAIAACDINAEGGQRQAVTLGCVFYQIAGQAR